MSAKQDRLDKLTQKQIYSDCIWISDEDAHTKLFLLCIARFFDQTARSSSMSYTQIARACGFSERQSKSIAKKVIGIWLRIERGAGHKTPSGNANLYHGVVPAHLLARLHEQKRAGRRVRTDESILAAVDRSMNGVHATHPGNDVGGAATAPVGCTACTDTPNILSNKRELSSSQSKFALSESWSLPDAWRHWTQRAFATSVEAIDRSAARFHLLQGKRLKTEDEWERAWQAWCHSERAFESIAPQKVAPAPSATVLRNAVELFVAGHKWDAQLGPPPGHPDCRVPNEIVTELLGRAA